MFPILSDFDFFKHPVCTYGVKENLIVRTELSSFKMVILCSEDTASI